MRRNIIFFFLIPCLTNRLWWLSSSVAGFNVHADGNSVVPFLDSQSTSSYTSDMSDYIETLSLSSHSSSDTTNNENQRWVYHWSDIFETVNLSVISRAISLRLEVAVEIFWIWCVFLNWVGCRYQLM